MPYPKDCKECIQIHGRKGVPCYDEGHCPFEDA